MSDPPVGPDALVGSSSSPPTRSASPHVDGKHTLRRPTSHGRLAKLMLPGRSRSGSTASQAETPVTAYADESVPASGRSTPEQRWRSGKAATASLLANDAKYKKFALQVDKALQTFESVNEWADFISFLSKLLKTLQGPQPPYAEIPRKLIVAKRLAQCLNPALPSGVHQRALDVYSHIFGTIGVEGLKRDLLIWSSGIFPFFQFAATSVRPNLLRIYDKYYLTLGNDLRPVTKALILALLPGMEEETGDFFDKVLMLLDRVCAAAGQTFFLQNVFLVLVTSPVSRLSALNYLSRRLQKPPKTSDNIDIGLIIRGVAATLDDENSLVRRGGLDLLLRILPMNGELIKHAEEADRRLLVRTATSVVLQREISLTRRVHTWLLGTDETAEGQLAYLRQNGLELLVSTLELDMQSATVESNDDLRPFKVFLSLLDRWEIGGLLSNRLAIKALQTIKQSVEAMPSLKEEFIVTASAVYDAIEPIIIWKAFHDAIDHTDDTLLLWTLTNVPQTDDEVTSIHIPVVLFEVLERLVQLPDYPKRIELVQALYRNLSPSLIMQEVDQKPIIPDSEETMRIYQSDTALGDDSLQLGRRLWPGIVRQIFDLSANRELSPEGQLAVLAMAERLIDLDSPALRSIDGPAWLGRLVPRLKEVFPFAVVDAVVSIALKASRCPAFSPRISLVRPELINTLLSSLFRFLKPDAAPHHHRAVDLLWEYNKLAEIHTLENVIARQMTTDMIKSRLSAMDAFGTLWRLTDDAMLPGEIFYVPILHVIDSLRSENPDVKGHAQTWMRCNLESYFRILDPLLLRMIDPSSHGDVAVRYIDRNALVHQVVIVETLFKFGGQSLTKICATGEIVKSAHPTLYAKAIAAFPNANTYLDLIVYSLKEYLSLEAKRPSEQPVILRLQGATLDIFELLVSSSEMGVELTKSTKYALLDTLSRTIRLRQTNLQHQTLRLLQFILNIHAPQKTHRRHSSMSEKPRTSEDDFEDTIVKTVIDGISTMSNRDVLQHWVDFVLAVAPSLRLRSASLHSLCDAFSQQVRSAAAEWQRQRTQNSGRGVTDHEIITLLTGLERVLSLSNPVAAGTRGEDTRSGTEVGSGILGLVSGVFISDTSDDKPKPYNLEYLVVALETLLFVWTVSDNDPTSDARSSAKIAAKNRQILEKMYKTQTVAVVAGCVSIWASPRDGVTDDAIFSSIDALTPSAQRVVEIVSDSVKQTKSVDASDATMSFLEAYVSTLEAPIAVQIWGTMFGFAKDLLAAATTPTTKAQLYPLLRCLTVLSRTVISTSALEDRRLRRDLQDIYPRVLDAVVGSISKVDASWKGALGRVPATEDNVYKYLAAEVIPNLRAFLLDQDKIAAACSSISISTVTPALKQYRASADILKIIVELTKVPAATKTWRLPVGDAFNDARFFAISLEDVALWKPLISSLFDSDKERFAEVLGRITAAPSANIFTNREQEMNSRSSNLRRLSFVLLAADQNHYLIQLPAIQEKLVDILRTNVVSPRVHSEVYLCLRVIMCRISAQHLTNFWPVILAELLRVFEGIMEEIPQDGSESLQLALAACKFLDLLLVIQSEDFQIHQWMFVTDTTDAVYPPEEFSAEAIMDTIAEILREHPHAKEDEQVLQLEESSRLRRPRLTNVKTINSMRQLEPFFSRASIDTFEGVYRDAGVDWAAVEEGLNGEIFG